MESACRKLELRHRLPPMSRTLTAKETLDPLGDGATNLLRLGGQVLNGGGGVLGGRGRGELSGLSSNRADGGSEEDHCEPRKGNDGRRDRWCRRGG